MRWFWTLRCTYIVRIIFYLPLWRTNIPQNAARTSPTKEDRRKHTRRLEREKGWWCRLCPRMPSTFKRPSQRVIDRARSRDDSTSGALPNGKRRKLTTRDDSHEPPPSKLVVNKQPSIDEKDEKKQMTPIMHYTIMLVHQSNIMVT